MRNERITLCSLTTAWTEVSLHTGRHQSSSPHVVWFNIISVQWVVSLEKQNVNSLALQPSTFCISKMLCIKRSFENISSSIPWGNGWQFLWWWPRTGEILGFLIGNRQTSKPALKLWEVGENEQSGQAGRAAWKETSTQWVVLLKAR